MWLKYSELENGLKKKGQQIRLQLHFVALM